MKTTLHGLVLGLLSFSLNAVAAEAPAAKDTRCYEMRVYYAAPGKLDALQARFRDHTCKLFEKHGMVNVGYWIPVENPENKLIYVLAYPSREAREKSWKEFGADPDWLQARKASEVDGKLTCKPADITFLQATDFSPEIKPSGGATARVFEWRTYTCTPNNLPNLLTRFRDHTLKLFEKHGMTNVAYWTPTDAGKGADNTLIYILAHASKEAAAEAFKKFWVDPVWMEVKAASEKAAGGPLTQAANGLQSVFMLPTNFSPLK
ncbi:MAG: NIPSNAP family protein [Kiritimatiellaeota bacterium]|nr:NIPSNAP family protein [Kiritimatiellota bacterium]